MYNRTLAIFVAILLLFSTAAAYAADFTAPQAGQAQLHMANPLDPSTWMKHHGGQMRINPAHPATWLVFMDPKAHHIAHSTFTNPANFPQFVHPQFWMQFANPNNWMAWVNPASYAMMFDPATYMGWMQPGPWLHLLDPGMYVQLMNPSAYTSFMNPEVYMKWMSFGSYTIPPAGSSGDISGMKWFYPNAWIESLAPGTAPQPSGVEAGKK